MYVSLRACFHCLISHLLLLVCTMLFYVSLFFPLINKLVHQPLGSLQVHLIYLNEQCFYFLLLMLTVVLERSLYAEKMEQSQKLLYFISFSFSMLFLYLCPMHSMPIHTHNIINLIALTLSDDEHKS